MPYSHRRAAFLGLIENYTNDLSGSGKHPRDFVLNAMKKGCVEAVTKTDPRMTSTNTGAVAVAIAKQVMQNEKASRGFIDVEITEGVEGAPTMLASFDHTVNEDSVLSLVAAVGDAAVLCRPGDKLGESLVADLLIVGIDPTPQVVESAIAAFKPRVDEAIMKRTANVHVATGNTTPPAKHQMDVTVNRDDSPDEHAVMAFRDAEKVHGAKLLKVQVGDASVTREQMQAYQDGYDIGEDPNRSHARSDALEKAHPGHWRLGWKHGDRARSADRERDSHSYLWAESTMTLDESKFHTAVTKSLHAAGAGGTPLFASAAEGWNAITGALAKHGLTLGTDPNDQSQIGHDFGGPAGHMHTYEIHKDGAPVAGVFLHVSRGLAGNDGGVDRGDMPVPGKHEFTAYLTGKKLANLPANEAKVAFRSVHVHGDPAHADNPNGSWQALVAAHGGSVTHASRKHPAGYYDITFPAQKEGGEYATGYEAFAAAARKHPGVTKVEIAPHADRQEESMIDEANLGTYASKDGRLKYTIHHKPETHEYVAKAYVDGKHHEGKTDYQDYDAADKADKKAALDNAHATAKKSIEAYEKSGKIDETVASAAGGDEKNLKNGGVVRVGDHTSITHEHGAYLVKRHPAHPAGHMVKGFRTLGAARTFAGKAEKGISESVGDEIALSTVTVLHPRDGMAHRLRVGLSEGSIVSTVSGRTEVVMVKEAAEAFVAKVNAAPGHRASVSHPVVTTESAPADFTRDISIADGKATYIAIHGEKAWNLLGESRQQDITASLLSKFGGARAKVKEGGDFARVMSAAVAVAKADAGNLNESVAPDRLDDIAFAINEAAGDRLADILSATVLDAGLAPVPADAVKAMVENVETRATLLHRLAHYALAIA